MTGVVHPEKSEEHVIPTRHLAGTATTRTIAREAEAQVSFVWNQTRATGKQHTLEQNQDGNVNGESVNVVNQEVRCTQSNGMHATLPPTS